MNNSEQIKAIETLQDTQTKQEKRIHQLERSSLILAIGLGATLLLIVISMLLATFVELKANSTIVLCVGLGCITLVALAAVIVVGKNRRRF
jgi:hypothetical protein